MTVYRVGPDGATVFSEDGRPLYTLTPGLVVVPGYSNRPGSPAAEHVEVMAKRVRDYPDKQLRPSHDYADKGVSHPREDT